jgi:hypothetical protein
MKLHHIAKRRQLPDWLVEKDCRVVDHRVLWIARRCGVSISAARTIFELAAFSDGERRQ